MRKKLNAGIAAAAMVALLGIGASTAGASSQDGIFQVKATKIESNGKKFEATHGLRIGGGGGGPVDPGTPEPEKKGVMTFEVKNCPAAYIPTFPGIAGFTGDVTWNNGTQQDVTHENNVDGVVKGANFINWAFNDWVTSIGGPDKITEVGGGWEQDELLMSSTPLNYTVRFVGSFNTNYMDYSHHAGTGMPYAVGLSCVTGITEWKDTKQTSAEGAFRTMPELTHVVQPPKTITNMNTMFDRASKFSQDISGWDVSNVTTWEDFDRGTRLDSSMLPPKFR